MWKRLILIAPLAALVLVVAAGWWLLVPRTDLRPLPADLIDAGSVEGRQLLAGAEAQADYSALTRSYQTQALTSYCGVATSVAVLTALGQPIRQRDFFTDAAAEVRPLWRVVLTGMPLDDLGGLLAAHGAKVVVHHADSIDLASFRATLATNLAREGDYLIVNYQRGTLGQDATGHISPLAAYNADSDRVLIMDTASHKYPPTWVRVESLFAAMSTVDSETGRTRGFVEVTGAAAPP
jgi:Phytochelatin synthase